MTRPHQSSTRAIRGLVLTAACLIVGAGTIHAFAQNYSSSDFTSSGPVEGSSGGIATSTSFSTVSSGGQAVTGDATSTNFELRAGAMYTSSYSPVSRNWRWYDDETDETPTTPLAAENVAPSSVDDGNIVKLRWTIAETAGIGDTGVKFVLQFSTSTGFENVQDVAEQGSCTGASQWCYASGAGADNSVISTGVLSDSDTCSAGTGNGCGTHNESGFSTTTFTQVKNAATEYEFTIEPSGASQNTVYFFRAMLVGASTSVPLDAGASYASLSTGGGTLSFNIDGLPAATTTSGVTTNIDTTSTVVPFGELPFTGSSIGANRLIVTTNASSGYEIFAYERQQLLDQSDAAIPPFDASNTAPASWSTGCTATSTGCWGYHTNASVLAGGSTRFAPDDTYAQFDGSPDEVAYSATPVTNEATDMVYRLAVNTQQDPGAYSTELVYIVTPVF